MRACATTTLLHYRRARNRSALLGLPRGATAPTPTPLPLAARLQVERLLALFGLAECRDTRIGDVARRGLSGGQRKRVSIASKLLTDPSVMFVDEPTSGLDSKAAEDLARVLQRLARDGRTVLCTIHQPRYTEEYGRKTSSMCVTAAI